MDDGMQLMSRTGRLLTADEHAVLLASEHYCTVRSFESPQLGVAIVKWLGCLDAPRARYSLERDGDPLFFELESHAINAYEDYLVSNDCGEWATAEDGRSLFIPIGNMKETAACDEPLPVENALIGDPTIGVSAERFSEYASW